MKKLAEKIDFLTRNMNLGRKLLINFCIVSLIPFMTSTMIYYYSAASALEKELGNYTTEITRQVDDRLSSLIQENERITNMIRFDEEVQLFLSLRNPYKNDKGVRTIKEIRRLFASIGRLRTNIRGVFLVNNYGSMTYEGTTDVAKTGYIFQEESWFQNIPLDGELHLLPVHKQDYAKGKTVVTFATKFLNFHNYNESGTLLIDFSPEIINQMSANIQLGETGYVFLLTDEGKPVNPLSRYPKTVLQDESFITPLQNDSGHFTLSYKGEKMLVGFSTSERTGLKIVGMVPFHEVSSGLRGIQYQILLIGSLSLVFILLISTYFSRTLTTPLKELEHRMLGVEKGDLAARIPYNRGDEIGSLGQRFNHMLDELRRLNEEVYTAQIREYQLELLHKESELTALQAQINPHFLYNTLNTMTCMAEVYEFEEMTRMSKSLAYMFQYSMNRLHTTTLADEIGHVKAYLEIIKIRYPDSFSYRITISDEVADAQVLKLIVQPLVENAIVHGLRGKEGHGDIWIRAFKKGGKLHLNVRDNGVGISAQQLNELQHDLQLQEPIGERSYNHIGLRNVNNRLHLFYGGKANIQINSEINKGTTIELILPYNLETGDHPNV
jgi:two-component system sensor histidine kinase YesM